MSEMSQQEISDYLERGAHVAHVATVRPDGRPHVTPVSFGAWDGKAYLMASEGSVKLNNILHNPKVALFNRDGRAPLQIRGAGRGRPGYR